MPEGLELVEKTIAILDGVNWSSYGNYQSTEYPNYVQGQYGDERTLIDGLLGNFLEKVLGFTLHHDLFPQMTNSMTGKRPDYIPGDTHLHPFVFDAKGTDTTDLSQHYDQIADYMRSQGLTFGVLANMRDLEVYTLQSDHPEAKYSFSFRKLYLDYQQDPQTVVQKDNTQHFLAFAKRFRQRELDRAGKIKAIIEARHGPKGAQLDLDNLVQYLHRIVNVLHDDVRRQRTNLPDILHYNVDRRTRVVLEIDAIAQELDSTMPERDVSELTLTELLDAPEHTTDGQAADRYLYRTAYFAMTRILLARVWEDIGFIEQALYDGGFKIWYQHCEEQIRRVLQLAFCFAQERYSWLYGVENNYTWYTPSEDVLVDVLYDFSRFDFRHLDADVLGAVYESYLDETDRKNKGQYYTPRPMVQFIWDRVGFDTPSRILRFEEGECRPRKIIDFCTGSGGFLVEAAKRIRETVLGADFDSEDPAALEEVSTDDLRLVMQGIIEGLRGAEINAFAYYLTEVNLLIQLTPIIAALFKKDPQLMNFGKDYALGVIHQDALKLHNRQQLGLISTQGTAVEGATPEGEVYEQDRRHDIVSLSGYKRTVYTDMKDNCGADYVCSNPPYVGEKGHKELFQYYRERFDYWSGHYQGKMDYFYWFVILGLSKLRKGGRLGFITTSYWPTASGAATLRRYILEHAKIIEMIDFGETRIFSDAPGQHNMVFVLERCEDKEERQNHRPVLVRVKQEFEGKSINQKINRLLDHIQEHIDNAPNRKFKDDYISIFPSPIPQKQMEGRPWAITYGESAGVVLHQMEAAGVQLSQVLEINAGVHSNADAVKSTDLSRLRPDQRQGIAEGDGIFILTKEEKNSLQIPDEEKGVVKITYKNSDIAPYIIEPAAPLFMLYIDNSFKPDSYPTILRHLKRFRPILESRLERYGENYSWYRLHRPHQRQHYESEKIVAPRWGKRIDFAYEPGGRYENSDINLFIKRPEVEEDIKYFLALLNSVALAFWREHKGQFKGVTRQSLLKSMPIYRIHFDPSTAEEVKQAKLDKMEECLTGGDCDAAYDILQQALDADQEDIVHDGMMALAGQIIDIKTDLTDYTDYFGTRLTRLSDGDPLPDIAPLALLRELPAEEQWSVYIHIQNGSLTVDENFSGSRDDFYFYRVKKKESDDNSITLREKGRGADTLTLKGNTALISYLKAVLPDQQEQLWREVKQTLVPRDTTVFTDERRRITQEVTAIREQVAGRQSVIDRIVLDLYGITDPDNRKMVLD